jgi:hypothetical protein
MKPLLLIVAAATLMQTRSADDVLAKLDSYLAGYEPKLSELIADETMVQTSSEQPSGLARDLLSPEYRSPRRRLISEVAFIALPNQAWLGFRHVKSVNDKPVEEGEASLASALRASSYESAKALVEASAAHNLGLPRTTNLPNLPLEFLHPRNRSRLLTRTDGNDRIRGVQTIRVILLERITPTLIRKPDGSDMPSVVRAWIDPRDGRLLRAEVKTFPSFESREYENSITVEFAANTALGLLTPVEMTEVFPVAFRRSGKSVAHYTNFRRFQTSARIVPQ